MNPCRPVTHPQAVSLLCFVLLSFASLGQVSAIEFFWDGEAGTDNWSEDANWDPDGVPTEFGDQVVIAVGANVRIDLGRETQPVICGNHIADNLFNQSRFIDFVSGKSVVSIPVF